MTVDLIDNRDKLGNVETLVVKVGSSLIASVKGGTDKEFLSRLAGEIATLMKSGIRVVLVSSGAVAAGMVELGFGERPTSLPVIQAAAAVGQSVLMQEYRQIFGGLDINIGQVLVTRDGLHDRRRYLHARNTLRSLLDLKVLPIVNENDTVAVEELRLKIGDNDALAVSVGQLVDADELIILSDVPGFYDRPPEEKEAKIIANVLAGELTAEMFEKAGGSVSGVGSGGMTTKLNAALASSMAAVPLVIADGKRENVIADILAGKQVGTFFAPREKRTDARRHWIAFGRAPAGEVVVDDGAVKALIKGKKSLLSIGVREVRGKFEEGDSVSIISATGEEIARGLANYSSEDIAAIAGRQSAEISDILGYDGCETVVHRDNLLVLTAGSPDRL